MRGLHEIIGILRVPGKQNLRPTKKEKLAHLRHRYGVEKKKWREKTEIKRQSDNCSLIREGEDSIGTDGDPRVHRGETVRVKP